MNFSDNLKKIRKEHNLSQEQLAEKLSVSRQSVSKWESNQAYPEMDKLLQICKMFNLNIDDLLNQDINEVNNTKQAKNNINKFFDDFLDYINKTINMFSNMKFKEKIKCIVEQIILIFLVTVLLSILGAVLSSVFENLFSFISKNGYYSINNIFKAIYILASLIFGFVLIIHIFKIRYLDYYILAKENYNDKKEKDNNEKKIKEIKFENKEEKIIIRDSKHSGYKFIYGLLKCFLFLIKCMAVFIATMLCLSLIVLVISVVISFMFVKTGIIFIGTLLFFISLIIINITILLVVYNFIVNRKTKKNRFVITVMTSLIFCGVGIGMFSIGITKFDIIDDTDSIYFVTEEQFIPMNKDLFFEYPYDNLNYVVSDNKDVRIVYRHSKYYELTINEYYSGYYIHHYLPTSNLMNFIRNNIKDINDKKIIDYSKIDIYIYTSAENIEVLKTNFQKHWNNI